MTTLTTHCTLVHSVEASELVPIHAYCAECGQIGCTSDDVSSR